MVHKPVWQIILNALIKHRDAPQHGYNLRNRKKYIFYWGPIEFPRDPLRSPPVGPGDSLHRKPSNITAQVRQPLSNPFLSFSYRLLFPFGLCLSWPTFGIIFRMKALGQIVWTVWIFWEDLFSFDSWMDGALWYCVWCLMLEGPVCRI